jgi:predicted deacylase
MLTIDRINCTLDFEQDGKHLGNLELDFSDNRHAFAKIPVPLACIKNESGPTLLLSAGNHGDEYEGQMIQRPHMP